MLSPILSVHDVDASIAFYTDKLKFTRAWGMTDASGKTTFASVQLGKAEVLLGTIDFVAAEDRGKLGTGIQLYIDLPAEIDINELYRHVQASGANGLSRSKTRTATTICWRSGFPKPMPQERPDCAPGFSQRRRLHPELRRISA